MGHHRGRGAGKVVVTGVVALWTLVAAAAGTDWSGRGHVVAVDESRGMLVLDHGAIPGLLPRTARTRFGVERPDLLRGVRAGDRVRFTLVAADDAHGLLRLASLEPDAPSAGTPWPGLLVGIALVVALGTLGGSLALTVVLWRSLRGLHRRVAALDHELGMLRRLGGETQDTVRQLVHALDEIGATVLTAYVRELRRRVPLARTAAGEGAASREPAPGLVVVQRGRTEVFRALGGGEATGLRVIWDRRRGERRTSRRSVTLERRRGERRAPLPETWTQLGFVLTPLTGEDAGQAAESRGPRPLRAVAGDRPPAR